MKGKEKKGPKYKDALLLNLMLNSQGSINCHKYEALKIKLQHKQYSWYSNFFCYEIGMPLII